MIYKYRYLCKFRNLYITNLHYTFTLHTDLLYKFMIKVYTTRLYYNFILQVYTLKFIQIHKYESQVKGLTCASLLREKIVIRKR